MINYVSYAIQLRKILHLCPELSFEEYKTKETLLKYISEDENLEVYDCGKWFYAVRRGVNDNKRIAFRADFDAVNGKDGLPGHYCGHDGHSAVLTAFAKYLNNNKPVQTVYLIFQPAEETGQGALLCRNIIVSENITAVYGMHNIPGAGLGTLLTKDGTASCASTGLEIKYFGAASHAAYPEAGKNPASAVAELILDTEKYITRPHKGVLLSTVIGVELGSESYGVSAGDAVIRFTLRGENQDEFDMLLNHVVSTASELAEKYGLKRFCREIERFPATVNPAGTTAELRSIAEKASLNFSELSEPFRWSEDFGYYLQNTNGAFFGFGAGEDHPQLHTEKYEFPDELFFYILSFYIELINN